MNNKIFKVTYNGPEVQTLLDEVKTKHLLDNEEYDDFKKIVNDNKQIHSHSNLLTLDMVTTAKMDSWDGKFDDITISGNRISLWANGEIKKFINLPETVSPKASEVTIDDTNEYFTADNVESVLVELVGRIKALEDQITSLTDGKDEIDGQ